MFGFLSKSLPAAVISVFSSKLTQTNEYRMLRAKLVVFIYILMGDQALYFVARPIMIYITTTIELKITKEPQWSFAIG